MLQSAIKRGRNREPIGHKKLESSGTMHETAVYATDMPHWGSRGRSSPSIAQSLAASLLGQPIVFRCGVLCRVRVSLNLTTLTGGLESIAWGRMRKPHCCPNAVIEGNGQYATQATPYSEVASEAGARMVMMP
jgi:hypothetical protein